MFNDLSITDMATILDALRVSAKFYKEELTRLINYDTRGIEAAKEANAWLLEDTRRQLVNIASVSRKLGPVGWQKE